MAERIDSGVQIGFSPEIGWQQWADGGGYRLARGEDFEQPPTQARRAFLSWASRNDLATHSSASDDTGTLSIQVAPRRGSMTLEDLAHELGRAPRWVRHRIESGEIVAWEIEGRTWITPREVQRVLALPGASRHAADEDAAPEGSIPEQRDEMAAEA